MLKMRGVVRFGAVVEDVDHCAVECSQYNVGTDNKVR